MNSWVRIKSGFYNGDLGLVQSVRDNGRVWLKLIPRLDMSAQQKDPRNKLNRFMSIRPPQKAFNPEEAKRVFGKDTLESKQEKDLNNKQFKVFKKQNFRKGFLYKQFTLK